MRRRMEEEEAGEGGEGEERRKDVRDGGRV